MTLFSKFLVGAAAILPLAHGMGVVSQHERFDRVATFPVCKQISETCNDDTETVAEIVAYSSMMSAVVYADSELGAMGFVDVSDPKHPAAMGMVMLGGEPTSVAVSGEYGLVCVNTSEDYVNTSGVLKVYHLKTGEELATHELGGQPDAIAVSPDGRYAMVAIENERDEDLGEGELPQMPAGYVVKIDMQNSSPADWKLEDIQLVGLSGLHESSDPEPEYVAINDDNIAVVTLQENNALVLVDLETSQVINSYTAGSVDLTHIDTEEEAKIDMSASLSNVPREPDGVAWIGTKYFATADEGDMLGGSRGFTIYEAATGKVVYTAGNTIEHIVASIGHYPDERSGNKGNEPENVFSDVYNGEHLLFVNSERSNCVLVYNVDDPTNPIFQQVLPAGVGPEGGVAIPSRDLLIIASEVDDRGDKIRSSINIYERSWVDVPQYPTIVSENRANGTPIPFSALSGLAAKGSNTLYAVEDSFYASSRIFKMDASAHPAVLTDEITIRDTKGVFADAIKNMDQDMSGLINDDGSVNIDPEGIAVGDDYFLVCSEGYGTVGSDTHPIRSLNTIFKTSMHGVIEEVIFLPNEVNAMQVRYGFEGIAIEGDHAVVAFQRSWSDEAHPRLGMYNMATKEWDFVHYPLDAPESQNGGWVGLSDITSLGNGEYLVLERDNQGGMDAAIKRVYRIDLNGVESGDVVSKELVVDLIPWYAQLGGMTPEKVEGMTMSSEGVMYVVNDNDGVDDNSGEMQLLRIHVED